MGAQLPNKSGIYYIAVSLRISDASGLCSSTVATSQGSWHMSILGSSAGGWLEAMGTILQHHVDLKEPRIAAHPLLAASHSEVSSERAVAGDGRI